MASRNAVKYTEDGRFDEKRSSQFPAFERAILQHATICLDEWRDKAMETANSLVSARNSRALLVAAALKHAEGCQACAYPMPVRVACTGLQAKHGC